MKPGQYFALIIGIMFVLMGVMGFIPAFVKEPTATPDMVNLGFTYHWIRLSAGFISH